MCKKYTNILLNVKILVKEIKYKIKLYIFCYNINGDNMKKTISIHLDSKEDYQNEYNKNILSYELSNYIQEETKDISLKDKLEFLITSDLDLDDKEKNHVVDMLRNSFGTDIREILHFSKKTIIANSLILLVGIFFLIIYYFIIPKLISELTLILGWVFIGEAICNLLYHTIDNTIKTKKKKQIVNAKVLFLNKKEKN